MVDMAANKDVWFVGMVVNGQISNIKPDIDVFYKALIEIKNMLPNPKVCYFKNLRKRVILTFLVIYFRS